MQIKQVMQQTEGNSIIYSYYGIQGQIRQKLEVGISDINVFTANTKALNLVKIDCTNKYDILRDYIVELATNTNPKIIIKLDIL